eukprot:m.80161 g.80161  ORF g.80161 m.80161 type:complete len:121 (-) comp12744_c0_seq4:156-518(-)
MSELHPEAFAFFTSVPLTFQTVHDGVNVEAFGPVFEIDPRTQSLARFRYNNYDRSPMAHLSLETVEKFYEYLPTLLHLQEDPSLVLKVRLSEGEMLVVNNHRVLHGRLQAQNLYIIKMMC